MELSDFTRNLTKEAKEGLFDPPIGRNDVIDNIFRILSQDGKSNALIIGEAGVGKTNIVEGLAYWIANQKVPPDFRKNEIIELNITQLNSGAMYVGQFEERVTKFLNEMVANPQTVVFIDEIHMIMGFGATSNSNASRDFSQIIKPFLARGSISVIGATTRQEYKRYIENDSAFNRRFELIDLPELDTDSTFQILKRIAVKYKLHKGLEFTESTLKNIVEVSKSSFPSRFQPDKSIDILKRCVRKYDTRISNNSTRKSDKIDDYIDHLNTQLKLIQIEDYKRVIKTTKDWLGVIDKEAVQLNLSLSEINDLLKK